jgi:hypothetical protein
MEKSLQNVLQQVFNKIEELKDFDINVDKSNIVEHNGELHNFLGRESSKTIAKKWVIGLQDYFVEKSKSEILNKLDNYKSHWENTQFKNIGRFNRLIENSKTKEEIQELEMEKENHLSFYHFFYKSIKLIESCILNNSTHCVIETETKRVSDKLKILKTFEETEETMTLEQLKETVRVFISEAKIKEAMKVIANWAYENADEQLKNNLSLLKGAWTELEQGIGNGVLSYQDIATRQNQLYARIIGLLDQIEFGNESKTIKSISNKSAPNNPKHPLSIFISYSKSDNDLRKELDTHLSSLRRREIVTNWDDRHIIGGELWDDAIKTKLKKADIILFLVSANFIATDYIWEHEIPIAEEQRQNGKARVIPIILKACQWTKLDFAKQMALPSKGIPINSFPDRDTAWLEVVEGIEKVINDVLKQ